MSWLVLGNCKPLCNWPQVLNGALVLGPVQWAAGPGPKALAWDFRVPLVGLCFGGPVGLETFRGIWVFGLIDEAVRLGKMVLWNYINLALSLVFLMSGQTDWGSRDT